MNSETYTCSICGQIHEDWPAIAFLSPDSYHALTEDDKKEIAEINEDFCTINNPEQIDRFIRATLFQKVNDHCEDLNYGLWVSLSEESFNDYKKNFNNDDYETKYFGWLSNDIPEYEFEESIPTTVFTKKGNSRPEIMPHSDFDHPFVKDYYNGISKKEAESRIHSMISSKE